MGPLDQRTRRGLLLEPRPDCAATGKESPARYVDGQRELTKFRGHHVRLVIDAIMNPPESLGPEFIQRMTSVEAFGNPINLGMNRPN